MITKKRGRPNTRGKRVMRTLRINLEVYEIIKNAAQKNKMSVVDFFVNTTFERAKEDLAK